MLKHNGEDNAGTCLVRQSDRVHPPIETNHNLSAHQKHIDIGLGLGHIPAKLIPTTL